ncbi:hypothetical protein FRC07_010874 [Ceratobasidium sp. 392]|nr:hypothetical protein FRC07_010874 [Ceratobasidium sp. 392]
MAGSRSRFQDAVDRLTSGSTRFELVYTTRPSWPQHIPSNPTPSSTRISVLDSSFNPPTLAHLALASSSPEDARLLLLSISNADKAPKPGDATPVQRLEMMVALAEELAGQGPSVAVAALNEPRFVGKSTLLLEQLSKRSAQLGDAETSTIELAFQMGWDTIIRVFAPRYYPSPDAMLASFKHFFGPEGSSILCARRPPAVLGPSTSIPTTLSDEESDFLSSPYVAPFYQQALDVTFNSPQKYPINLKILSNGELLYNTEAIVSNQVHHWENLKMIDADRRGLIEIRVYKLHWLGRRERIGFASLEVSEMTKFQSNITASDASPDPLFSMSVMLDSTKTSHDAAKEAQDRASKAVTMSSNLFQRIQGAQDAVETILSVVENIAELNPTTKPAVGMFKIAWETLKKHQQLDGLVEELVNEMGDVLPFVASVENRAKILKTGDTIKDLLMLVEEASQFVIDYMSTSSAARAGRSFFSSAAQSKVDEFVDRFKRLKENFDRGVISQALQGVEKLLDDADQALLDQKLTVPDGASYGRSQGCLKGTRVVILEDIHNWTLGSAANSPTLFWLYGPAGCGKSSVAASVCESLRKTDQLGGSFFCRRDSEHLRKSTNVISHLAQSLAIRRPSYGKELAKILRADPSISQADSARIRFDGLITNPLKSVGKGTNFETLIVVIDAVDESGTPESRVELVRCLLDLSRLVVWLKVLVTSRPNDEIRRLLEQEQEHTKHHNLFAEDKASVSRDIKAYIWDRLSAIPIEETGRSRWPDDRDIDLLSICANGLFIWAHTACNLIQNSVSPGDALVRILNGQRSKKEKKALGTIYTTALSEGLDETDDVDVEIVQLCVGMIILVGLRRPLPDAALAGMLSSRIGKGTLTRVINRLGSVIYRDEHSAVRVLHQSFSDYMMGADCPEEYRIDLAKQNAELATSCLDIMLRDLKFNICGLENSFVTNEEVVDLNIRIASKIQPALMYSCVYWTTHLIVPAFNTVPSKTIARLEQLLNGPYLLYWIEVLSLANGLRAVIEGMAQMMDWVDAKDDQNKYTKIAVDLYRFMTIAYDEILLSTPHLYVSALPFGAANFATLKALKAYFPNTLSVVDGINLWNAEPCLRTIDTLGEHLSYSRPPMIALMIYSPTHMSLSADGRWIATGVTRYVHIRDAHTGTRLPERLDHGFFEKVTSVAISSDGRRIASAVHSQFTVHVWDTDTGNALFAPMRGHSSQVTSVAISSDGRRIISGSEDMTVRVWDALAGVAALDPLRGHSDFVRSVVLSPDNQRVASGSDDGVVYLWNAHSGTTPLRSFRGHTESVASVAFSPDSRCIISGSHDKTVRVWDTQTGAALLDPMRGHSDWVTSVAMSPNGQQIVSGSEDDTVRIWNARTGVPQGPIYYHPGTVTDVAFFPDGRRIVSSSKNGTIRVWDAQIDAALLDPPEGHYGTVTSVAFSPDDKRIVSGSADRSVRVWNAQTGAALLSPLRGHSKRVTFVAFSPDDQRIISGSEDKTVRVWDAHTGVILLGPMKGHSDSVMAAAFSLDGQRVVSGSRDGTVRIWDAKTGTALFSPLQGYSGIVAAVGLSTNGEYAAFGGEDGGLRTWDLRTGTMLLDLPQAHPKPISCLAFSPNNRYIASGAGRKILIRDVQTGVELLPHPLRAHGWGVSYVAFSPDGKRIISSSDGPSGDPSSPQSWDTQTGAELLQFRGHSNSVTSIAWSSNGQRIVSGSLDQSIRIWDTH